MIFQFHGPFGRDDAEVFAFRADQPDFGGTDSVVDAGAGVAGRRRVVGSASYVSGPLMANVS
jgi:hypothetical protein